MITCSWCGTNYAEFQSKCDNCGGSLPLPLEEAPAPLAQGARVPPPAPRSVPRNYVWRILSTDGWAITGGVFLLLGAIFFVVGIGLTIPVVTIFVGLPFVALGLVFLVAGGVLGVWRHRVGQETIEVLTEGEAVLGEIVEVHQDYAVRINGRHPWNIVYRYGLGGRAYDGKVSTLSRPDLSQQPGKPVYVLYSRDDPTRSTLYPHPYGYYGG